MTSMQWNLREWNLVARCIDMSSYWRLMLTLGLRSPCFQFPFSFTTGPQGHFKRQTTPLDLQQILFLNMELMACMGMKEHISWDHGTALGTTWEN